MFNKVENIKDEIILKHRILDFLICDVSQAVDKCRNCMSQQPVLMRKSAKNVII